MRYRKYFLNHLLWLDDGFCHYYLQNPTWITEEILDVQVVVFNWPEEAEQWLTQCAEHDPETTLRYLRTFLADHCQEDYTLHRMNNRRVLKAAARQISQNLHQIVIEPRIGWAVQVDPLCNKPVVPVAVEPDSEYSHLLEELQTLLNGLVADQQKRNDEWEARMDGMNRIQRAWFTKKQIDDASKEHLKESALDTISFLAHFYPVYLKTLWKVVQAPSRMAKLTAEALATGSMDPLKEEIDKIVTPVARNYEEAQRYKTMLTILLSNRQTHEILWDFAKRYYNASHPIDLARMGAKGVTEVMLNILLALVSAGTVVALNVAAKSAKLVKVAKLLEKIAFIIKKLGPESKVVNKLGDLMKKEKKVAKAARKAENLVPDKRYKPPESLDDGPKKEYGKQKDKDGPKTTTKTEADSIKGKLNGEVYGPKRLNSLRKYLKRRGAELRIDDPKLPARMRGAYNGRDNVMYLRSDATEYEVWHELSHYLHCKKIGKKEYMRLERPIGPEQYVYDQLRGGDRRWKLLTPEERDHARWYVEASGGVLW